MEIEFIPIDYDYFDFEEKNYIRIVGRTNKGKKVCIIDSYEPNFWVILKSGHEKEASKLAEKISKLEVKNSARKSKVTKTLIKDKKFLGRPVKSIQVFVTNHKDMHDIASEIGDSPYIEARREFDIPIITKYIKEKNVLPLHWYTIKGEIISDQDFGGFADSIDIEICLKADSIKESKSQQEFQPKVLAYDIETSATELGKGKIYMIALYGKNFEKVLTWKKTKSPQKYVEHFKDEADMIEGFVKTVNEYDPDVLTGYFSDGFDLPYLKAISQKHKTKFNLGITEKGPTFTKGRIPSGKIPGIVHIDIYRFIRYVFSQYLQSESLSLNEVSKELIGESKNDFDFARLSNMKDSDWKDFISYNLQDTRVTYKLFEKIWPDIKEFCKIVKEPLFDMTRASMSNLVENYIIHNLDRFDEIAEKRPMNNEIAKRRSYGKFEGALVLEPKPGLYNDMAVFDFTSMHASIIVSFNISKSTLLEKKEKNSYETPVFNLDGKHKSFYFTKEKGFFPTLLGEVVDLRKKYKAEYQKDQNAMTKARSNAYKLLANASYGYQAFFGARYYCREAAASTLAFVRDFSTNSINKIKDAGYNVVFSDTDSIGFERSGKTKEETDKLLKKLNSELPGIMELDHEGYFKRGIFVSARGSTTGAKKKYALLDEKNKIKIRGFETVRRDWCGLTREMQSEILQMVLEDGDFKRALEKLKQTVKNLKTRKVDNSKLINKSQLKHPINEYLTKGPHVKAAQKMLKKGLSVTAGMLIEYYIGETNIKTKTIGEKVYLPEEKARYDIDYYLNNQILPAVENIFEVFKVDVREIMEGESQKKLF